MPFLFLFFVRYFPYQSSSSIIMYTQYIKNPSWKIYYVVNTKSKNAWNIFNLRYTRKIFHNTFAELQIANAIGSYDIENQND